MPCKYQNDTVHHIEPHSYLIIPTQEGFKYVNFTQKDNRLDNCRISVGFLGGATDILLLQSIQTSCGPTHPSVHGCWMLFLWD